MQEDTPLPRPLYVIKLGDTYEDLRRAQGDFEHWIVRGLGDTPLPVVVLDPRQGDALPPPSRMAGAVLTGSHAMVSDRADWSETTGAWLRGVVAAGVPVLGICYGHQLLAHALGGEAGDHPAGQELGTVSITLAPQATGDALMGELPSSFAANVVHRQSALRLPPGAVPLAGNAFEPHQAFRVGRSTWGVQFHPEFDSSAMAAYVAHAGRPAPVAPTPEAAGLLRRFGALAMAAYGAARQA